MPHDRGVAYLSDEDRYLRATSTLPIATNVTCHSIIARVDPRVELAQSSDGIVPYASAHLDGAAILAIRAILNQQ